MRTLAAAAALLAMTLPSGGLALSCEVPDFAAAVQTVAQAPQPYAILLGTLTPTGEEVQLNPPSPADGPQGEPPPEFETTFFTMQARFEGRRLGTWGFRKTEPANVTMERICSPAISSCPSFDQIINQEAIMIVRVMPNGYQVDAEQCGSSFLRNPTRRDLRIAYDCAFGRDCPVRSENR